MKTPLESAYAHYVPALRATIVFSVFANLLQFVGPLYMLQIYDRVLVGRNEMTLVFVTALAAFWKAVGPVYTTGRAGAPAVESWSIGDIVPIVVTICAGIQVFRAATGGRVPWGPLPARR